MPGVIMLYCHLITKVHNAAAGGLPGSFWFAWDELVQDHALTVVSPHFWTNSLFHMHATFNTLLCVCIKVYIFTKQFLDMASGIIGDHWQQYCQWAMLQAGKKKLTTDSSLISICRAGGWYEQLKWQAGN